RYARAVDKLQAFAQNVFSQGRNWRENGVTAEKSRAINRAAREFDPALTQAFELLYQRATGEQLWPEQEQGLEQLTPNLSVEARLLRATASTERLGRAGTSLFLDFSQLFRLNAQRLCFAFK
ncbi:MAG TPA: hypothetical protein VH164_17520, partial [Ktedonobacteraceae bacterium]|nr:hypothetical protein [Ktedonobacteraceae bacterium]